MERVLRQRDDNELPSGVVTFLFTDIAGSGRVLRSLDAERAEEVFDHHDMLLSGAWRDHNGYIVNTEGDSFFVAFADTEDAVHAALDAQRRIGAATWPDEITMQVRMGIHAGLAAPRRGDYLALGVHRAARLMSAAQGGQILVSETIAEHVASPTGYRFTPIGHYRLRDFDGAAAVLRVDTDDLPIVQRSIRATPAARHNLISRSTSFIGRQRESAAITNLIEPRRVLNLVGPGGMGKTRLATEVGLAAADDWPDGVWMVELADIRSDAMLAGHFADVLGAPEVQDNDRWGDVLEHVRDLRAIVIIDNAEHHIDRCAAFVLDLVQQCPHLAVVMTSREPLNIDAETVFRVRPLSSVADAGVSPAAQLFIDRARDADPAYEIDRVDVAVIDEICAALEGLPLAIEIAAARVGVMQIDEIHRGLSDRYRLLRSRDRSLPDRHRTMQGLLGWSYRLLTPLEQAAFRRIAVFSGDFSIDAAVPVVAGPDVPADEAAELVWSLVDKSLLMPDFSKSATRYRLPESVHQYAIRLLIDHDDPIAPACRFVDWCLENIAPWQVFNLRWLDAVSLDLANLRSVVDLIEDTEPERAQQIMCTIGRYHDAVQSFRTGTAELTRATTRLHAHTPSLVALLTQLADLLLRQGEVEEASSVLARAMEIEASVGPPPWDEVATARTAGDIAIREDRYDDAIAIAQDQLEHALSARCEARMWNLLGLAHFADRRWPEAAAAFENELAASMRRQDDVHITSAHGNLAEVALRRGDDVLAAEHQSASLEGAVALGQPVLVAYAQILAGHLAARSGDWGTAVELHAAADTTLVEHGHELFGEDRQAAADVAADAVAAIGSDAVANARLRGVMFDEITGVELARTVLTEPTRQATATTTSTAKTTATTTTQPRK